MTGEKEMFFVRNIRSLTGESVESHTMEYQVVADAHIVGGITYGPYYFTIWEFADKDDGEERWLCLRVREKAHRDNDRPWATATRTGFYHGGGIADELVALASLFLRRRLKLGPLMRMDDSPILLSSRKRRIDKDLVQGHSNLAELQNWLVFAKGLNPKLHQRFILATKLYHQALELIETKPDLAYLNLISAIEVLAQKFEMGKPSLNDVDQKLAELVDQVKGAVLRKQIEKRILDRERFLRRKFVEFIVNHTDRSFWQAGGRPKRGRIRSSELRNIMNRVYDQRSRTLHEGEPFPPSIFDSPMQGAEIDFRGMIMGKRKWEPKDFIPNPFFFERLVNHVLKNFLKRNQTG